MATSLLALALVWLTATLWISQLRALGREAAARELSGYANLLSDHTDRTLQSVDLLLALLTSRLEFILAGGRTDLSGHLLHSVLSRDTAGLPQIRRAFVFDEKGRAVADSHFPEPRALDANDRPHFVFHRDDPAAGLFISEPLRSRVDGDWSIILSRRLSHRDGSFAGVVAATVRPEYFSDMFRASMDLRDTKVVLSRDRVVMATGSPGSPPSVGTTLDSVSGLFKNMRGVETGVSPVFGVERMSAYARSERFPAILVVVTRPMIAIAAATLRTEQMILAAGALMTGLIAAISLMFARKLRSLEFRFRDGIERMTDGFVLLDDRERIIAWNSRAEKLLPVAASLLRVGIPLRELIGQLVDRMQPRLSRAERDELIGARYAAATSTEPTTFKTLEDRVIEAQTSATSFGGKVTLLRDVTDRERHQDALERALKVEREANELHRRFVTMASHEFRTPLAVIDGAAQRLAQAEAGASSGTGEKLERIRNAVRSMTMLIDRTLSSARLEAGTISLEMQPLDLRKLVVDACERQRQISPDFDIARPPVDDALMVLGDARLLDQAFDNLLSNAVKYSGRSRRIEVAIARSEEPAGELRISIEDHGIGIPSDELDKLFTRFFRARTAQGIAGTGLGLHLTSELVALHGGRIEVESRLGHGTRFTVVLPRAGEASHADAA